MVFSEGFTYGNVGGGRLDVRYHHFRYDGIAGGEQPAPPVAFETEFVADITQVGLAIVVGVIDLIGDFYRLEAQAERFAVQDGLRSLVAVARVKEELGACEGEAFLVNLKLAVIKGVR